ncbi:hypothetical protein, partial [Pantoea agglomerans]|uniref:hypothetical protein n=1 Tax=Enterobacter agglomerans TaxID=549 RepID=UPI001A8C5D33
KIVAIGACRQKSARIWLFPRTRCLASDKYTLRITYEQDSTKKPAIFRPVKATGMETGGLG